MLNFDLFGHFLYCYYWEGNVYPKAQYIDEML